MKWISVKDDMPIQESEVDVYISFEIIASNGDDVFVTCVSAGMQPHFWCQFGRSDVTHWMPLPTSPRATN